MKLHANWAREEEADAAATSLRRAESERIAEELRAFNR